MIDQRLLPGKFEVVSFEDYHQVVDAIRKMVVRGAPAIGASAAFGMALAAQTLPADEIIELRRNLRIAAEDLKASRPTAINLTWAVERILRVVNRTEIESVPEMRTAVLELAQCIADEDVEINQRMAEHGAGLIKENETIIHHCNTGALATVDWGTALGVIRMAHKQGQKPHVLVVRLVPGCREPA